MKNPYFLEVRFVKLRGRWKHWSIFRELVLGRNNPK